MPRVTFTTHIARHVACPAHVDVSGETVRSVLEEVFREYPLLRGYVLDEQGAVRKHVAVFVGGEPARDRRGLTDAVTDATEIHVMQALSGGN